MKIFIKLTIATSLVLLSSLANADAVYRRGAVLRSGNVTAVSRTTVRRFNNGTTVAVRRTAVVNTNTIGSRISVLPRSGCRAILTNNIRYFSCGSVFYKPVYHGSRVSYTVVRRP